MRGGAGRGMKKAEAASIREMFRLEAQIDLGAISSNLSEVRRAVGPGVGIMAVVKANAYGHGAVGVAYEAVRSGASYLGVGDVAEAVELRRSGIEAPILILGATPSRYVPVVVEHGLSAAATDPAFVRVLAAAAAGAGRKVKVHVKVDTGMGRLGMFPSGVPGLVREIQNLGNIEIEGVFTHFPSSDREIVMAQVRSFRRVLEEMSGVGVNPRLVHAANSSAIFMHPESHFNMVRPGISLYGIDPSGQLRRAGAALSPVLGLSTEIVFLKDVPAGTSIGYQPGYTAPKATKIATLPVGYDDGYPYSLSNKARVIVRGKEAMVAGRISMDYTTIDVGHVEGVSVGDRVILIGSEGGNSVRVEDLAQIVGTIPYEITVRLGNRVGRVFVNRGAVSEAR